MLCLCRLQIVGLTDQLVHQRIAQEKYNEYVFQIEELVSVTAPL